MKLKIIAIGFILLMIPGCSSQKILTDELGNEYIKTISMKCNKPYDLTQDCNNWAGASRKIVINDFDIKVAGSEDGKVVLVMDAHLFKNSLKSPFSLYSKSHTEASNNSFKSVSELFEQKGIKILRVLPLRSFENIDGYVMELNEDGYTILKEYSKKKDS